METLSPSTSKYVAVRCSELGQTAVGTMLRQGPAGLLRSSVPSLTVKVCCSRQTKAAPSMWRPGE